MKTFIIAVFAFFTLSLTGCMTGETQENFATAFTEIGRLDGKINVLRQDVDKDQIKLWAGVGENKTAINKVANDVKKNLVAIQENQERLAATEQAAQAAKNMRADIAAGIDAAQSYSRQTRSWMETTSRAMAAVVPELKDIQCWRIGPFPEHKTTLTSKTEKEVDVVKELLSTPVTVGGATYPLKIIEIRGYPDPKPVTDKSRFKSDRELAGTRASVVAANLGYRGLKITAGYDGDSIKGDNRRSVVVVAKVKR